MVRHDQHVLGRLSPAPEPEGKGRGAAVHGAGRHAGQGCHGVGGRREAVLQRRGDRGADAQRGRKAAGEHGRVPAGMAGQGVCEHQGPDRLRQHGGFLFQQRHGDLFPLYVHRGRAGEGQLLQAGEAGGRRVLDRHHPDAAQPDGVERFHGDVDKRGHRVHQNSGRGHRKAVQRGRRRGDQRRFLRR